MRIIIIMLIQTSKILYCNALEQIKDKILNQSYLKDKANNKQHMQQNLNSIKIQFNRMSSTECDNSKFDICQCPCGAVLTIDDQRQQNSKQLCYSLDEETKQYVWVCRYCKKENRSKNIYFCRNGFKKLIEKNTQRTFIPPILIFVIDISGSMSQTIVVQNSSKLLKDKNLVSLSKQLIEMILKSSYYQKQSSMNKRTKQKDKNPSNLNYFSKITLFMAIIQHCINKIKSQAQFHDYRVGFVFFNDSIFVLKPVLHKLIPTFLATQGKFKHQFPFDKKFVDFDSFESLFDAGKQIQRFFGDSRLKNCDCSKLAVQNLQTEGQTALGPALAFSLGIASSHDIGSRIVLISDLIPTTGMLSIESKYLSEEIFVKMKKVIQMRQVTIGILSWISEEKTWQNEKKSEISFFIKQNGEHIKQIMVDLTIKQTHLQILRTILKSIQNLIKLGSLGQALQIQIKCSNPKIEITKLKYDTSNVSLLKFIVFGHKNWVQLKPKKLESKDMLFPVFTQIVIKYQDFLKKEKYLFVSYVKHRLVDSAVLQGVSNQSQFIGLQPNQCNLKELLSLQLLHGFDRDKIIPQIIASSQVVKSAEYFSSGKVEYDKLHNNAKLVSLNDVAKLESRLLNNEQQEESEFISL